MTLGLTFIDSALIRGMGVDDIEVMRPDMWDHQTLVILHNSDDIKRRIMNNIRSAYKPTSHSEGTGYEIDVYTNLNYSMSERNPAMRNIRAVYCDMNIMTMDKVNSRFPNSYIIKVKEAERREINYDITRRTGREISEVSRNTRSTSKIW